MYLARGEGGLWQLGPIWDFDISMGNSDYGASSVLRGARVWPNPPAAVGRTSYTSEVRALRRWLRSRIAWMDGHVRSLRPG